MKIRHETEIEVGTVRLDDVNIGGENYSIEITPLTCNVPINEPPDGLRISFRGRGFYEMWITRDGIGFRREVLRPSHDHSDDDELRVVDGKPKWVDTMRCHNWPRYQVEFGPITVKY